MSLRERKKAATRAALIATARRLFAEKGYDNATLGEICEAVQIHPTTFFSYFQSKEELAFARTLDMLEMFKKEMADKPPEIDATTLFWNFMHEFSLRARSEESALMQSMDAVPALRSRYTSIVRAYEDELATAFAREDGVDPKADLYARLKAAALLSTVVATARWLVEVWGARDAWGSDPEIFPKMILANFPTRKQFETEQARFMRNSKRKRSHTATKPAPVRTRRR